MNIQCFRSSTTSAASLAMLLLCAATTVTAIADEQRASDEVREVAGGTASPPQRVESQSVATLAQRRAQTRQTHPELGLALGLDAETQERLVDLLTEPQMKELERAIEMPGPWLKTGLQARLDAWNRQLDALRSLLGEAGLERYQIYFATISERRQANLLDLRLAPKDRLDAKQKDKLITLFAEDGERLSQRMFQSEAMDEVQGNFDLRSIAAQEAGLRNITTSHRWLAEHAAQFLTPPQQQGLAQMHELDETALQRSIEQARRKVGIDAAASSEAQASTDGASAQSMPVSNDLQLDLTIEAIGNLPVRFNHMTRNGEPVMVEIAGGLFAEVTPTVYGNDRMVLHMRYYEQRGARRHKLGANYLLMHVRERDSRQAFDDVDAVVMGSRVYMISTRIGALPM
ncbi:MAG TPA: hypothetical protein VH814_24945 [Steroidobacteraceae bacterium]|jgi:hypothetical protein